MEFLPKEIDFYTEKHTSEESEILKELNRETYAKVLMPRMLSGHLQGRVLSMLSKMINPERILEIGTYTGYSALCLAEGLKENGKLITIDINEELEEMVDRFIKKSNLENKIVQKIGNAIDIIKSFDESEMFDLVFIDADKENYLNYYHLVFDKVKKGGYIIADNVLWSGKVVGDNKKDKDTLAIMEYNDFVQNDSRVENVLFPIRDGLLIAKKI
jgi:caffeoyl-CoA O-methyltransferase